MDDVYSVLVEIEVEADGKERACDKIAERLRVLNRDPKIASINVIEAQRIPDPTY